MSINRPPIGQPNAPTTGWRVIGQQPWQELGPDQRVQQGVKVSFVTGGGVAHSVFIPQDRYTPDNVRGQIAALAVQLDQVQGMSG